MTQGKQMKGDVGRIRRGAWDAFISAKFTLSFKRGNIRSKRRESRGFGEKMTDMTKHCRAKAGRDTVPTAKAGREWTSITAPKGVTAPPGIIW